MSTGAHFHVEIWAIAINALLPRFFSENVPQEAHDLLALATKRPDEDEVELKTRLSKARKQVRHMFSSMEKANYFVGGLKPYICKEMLQELRSMPPYKRSIIVETRRNGTAEGRSQRKFTKHAQQRQPNNQ